MGGLCLEYGDSIPVFWGEQQLCEGLSRTVSAWWEKRQCLYPSGLSRALLRTEMTDTSTGHLVTLPPAIPTSHLRPVLLVRVN